MKKSFFILVFLLSAVSAYAYPIKVIASEVIKKSFSKEITLPAECTYYYSRDYISIDDGIIDFVENSKESYKKGDLIIAIDKESSEASKEEALANFKLAKISYERDKILHLKKIISDEKLDQSKSLFSSAKSKYDLAKKIYENKVIYAPFDGDVSRIKFKEGDLIQKGDFLFSITSGDKKFISYIVPEKYKIREKDVDGIVSYNGNKYKIAKINISNSISRDKIGYNGTAIIEEKNSLQHNSFVSITLYYSSHTSLAIPESAIFMEDGQNKIYIIDENNKAKLISLELGDRKDGFIEIKSENLKLGQKIVTEGIQKLSDGQEVKVIE